MRALAARSACLSSTALVARSINHGRLLWEWLLDEANRLGIRGGSAFKAMAGFGRKHVLHESQFFELAGSLTVEVEFIVSEDEAEQLLEEALEQLRARRGATK